jgi:Protein of unknown function (DUF3352)
VAFLALGATVVEQFVPSPASALANHPEFQQVMRSDLSPFDSQVYVDVNKMVASGNLPVAKFPADTQAIVGAMNSIGLVSHVVSGKANRFDLAISLKLLPNKEADTKAVPSAR